MIFDSNQEAVTRSVFFEQAQSVEIFTAFNNEKYNEKLEFSQLFFERLF